MGNEADAGNLLPFFSLFKADKKEKKNMQAHISATSVLMMQPQLKRLRASALCFSNLHLQAKTPKGFIAVHVHYGCFSIRIKNLYTQLAWIWSWSISGVIALKSGVQFPGVYVQSGGLRAEEQLRFSSLRFSQRSAAAAAAAPPTMNWWTGPPGMRKLGSFYFPSEQLWLDISQSALSSWMSTLC